MFIAGDDADAELVVESLSAELDVAIAERGGQRRARPYVARELWLLRRDRGSWTR
jgi:hypothetical protein